MPEFGDEVSKKSKQLIEQARQVRIARFALELQMQRELAIAHYERYYGGLPALPPDAAGDDTAP